MLSQQAFNTGFQKLLNKFGYFKKDQAALYYAQVKDLDFDSFQKGIEASLADRFIPDPPKLRDMCLQKRGADMMCCEKCFPTPGLVECLSLSSSGSVMRACDCKAGLLRQSGGIRPFNEDAHFVVGSTRRNDYWVSKNGEVPVDPKELTEWGREKLEKYKRTGNVLEIIGARRK